MSSAATFPYEGMRVHQNSHGITVLRLHYSADEEKNTGEKLYAEDVKRDLSPWANEQLKQMTDAACYLREYEIDAEAVMGAKIFQLNDAATLEESFPIPPNWTRRMAIDPHPSVPHAFLWEIGRASC